MRNKANKFKAKYRYSIILMREMVRTDFKVKYQDSILGYFWSVLRPLFLFGILYMVFSVGLRVGKGIDNWPVALLAGVVLWQFFTDVTKSGLKTIVSHGSLIRKIKFPRYTIVISGTLSSLITLFINLMIVAFFAIVNGVPFQISSLLIIPLILEVFLFSLGLAFFLSAVNVKFRDIGHIWEILIRGGFYASAIIFPVSVITAGGRDIHIFVGKLLLTINPVAQAIQDFRHFAINPEIESLLTLSNSSVVLYIIPIVISILTFVFGAWYFKQKSPYFAEEF